MMRIPVIGGNWKMNTTLSEAESLVKELLPLGKIHSVETILCPPFISVARVKDLIKGSGLKLGAQNMYYEKSGA
ncbi:MAG: triose-phosphate isomerase, partial [Chloroflexi bacterium]|nr:triose-phosphate isomerase [Chloroflexota bacterium]